MNFDDAQKKLSAINQTDLLKYWDSLSESQKSQLLLQIDRLNIPVLNEQRALLHGSKNESEIITPFTDFSSQGNLHNKSLGEKLIADGQVGCLLIAGGQGTRLGISGPKGIIPITPLTHKSLFQLFAEKTVAAGKQVKRVLPLAIMTSPQNHMETVSFFEEHRYFGLEKEQISFFSQEELPLLNEEGHLFLENSDTIATGPDGNGFSLRQFVLSGIWKRWHDRGIRFLNFILIDNPLADPFDAELIGFHVANGVSITVKCTQRIDPEEKVGVLVRAGKEKSAKVIEYSEMDQEEMGACTPDGRLKHICANLSLFCFSMEFVERAEKINLPLHKAFKSAKFLGKDGKIVRPGQPNCWKFERFIFDLLPKANKVQALLYPREQCFAPLKNGTGKDSIEQVQLALLKEAKRVAEKVTGLPSPSHPFELSFDFFYPTESLLKKWKNKKIPPKSYILA